MAKSGTASNVKATGGVRSEATRQILVDAAIETLKDKGFVGASARAIAEQAGTTQGLIFYHFGSVTNLLLSALDAVSTARLEQYGTAIADTGSPSELVDAATEIFRTDLDAGYITVLVEMIAGASSSPELASEVAARIRPWRQFAQVAIDDSLRGTPLAAVVPSADAAYAVVAFYLGLELLSHLDGDRGPALDLFAHARVLAGLFERLSTTTTSKETT